MGKAKVGVEILKGSIKSLVPVFAISGYNLADFYRQAGWEKAKTHMKPQKTMFLDRYPALKTRRHLDHRLKMSIITAAPHCQTKLHLIGAS
jgi:hypothetical protein